MASERARPRAPPFIDPPGYARHRPEATLLYQLVGRHYPEFVAARAAAGRNCRSWSVNMKRMLYTAAVGGGERRMLRVVEPHATPRGRSIGLQTGAEVDRTLSFSGRGTHNLEGPYA